MDRCVGPVERTADITGTSSGWGFEILDKKRRPLLIVGYSNELAAPRGA